MELKNYQLICHFCGVHLDNSTVNSICTKNSSENQIKDRLTTSNNIPNEFINTQRHFFGTPVKDFPEKSFLIILGSQISRILIFKLISL